MSLEEWDIVEPDSPAEPIAGNGFEISIEPSGYGNDGAIIRFDNGVTVVVGKDRYHPTNVHIQTYGTSTHLEPDDLRSGRTDLGERRHYLYLRRKDT